jgi:hypothetical protein
LKAVCVWYLTCLFDDNQALGYELDIWLYGCVTFDDKQTLNYVLYELVELWHVIVAAR